MRAVTPARAACWRSKAAEDAIRGKTLSEENARAAGEAAVVEEGAVGEEVVPVRPPPDDVEPDDVDAWVDAVWFGVPDVGRVVSAMQSSAYSKRAKSAESLASKTKGDCPRFHRWWTTTFAATASGLSKDPLRSRSCFDAQGRRQFISRYFAR